MAVRKCIHCLRFFQEKTRRAIDGQPDEYCFHDSFCLDYLTGKAQEELGSRYSVEEANENYADFISRQPTVFQ